jgi:hypothetical protein
MSCRRAVGATTRLTGDIEIGSSSRSFHNRTRNGHTQEEIRSNHQQETRRKEKKRKGREAKRAGCRLPRLVGNHQESSARKAFASELARHRRRVEEEGEDLRRSRRPLRGKRASAGRLRGTQQGGWRLPAGQSSDLRMPSCQRPSCERLPAGEASPPRINNLMSKNTHRAFSPSPRHAVTLTSSSPSPAENPSRFLRPRCDQGRR